MHSIHSLAVSHVQSMFVGAYVQILSDKDMINEANLYPVPDKDTGNNLVRTFQGIHKRLEGESFADIHVLRRAILESALISASGNAGIIMTSFIDGFLSCFTDQTRAIHLTRGFTVGAKRAYETVHNPQQGTILDLMRQTAQSIQDHPTDSTPSDLLKSAYQSAMGLLETTRRPGLRLLDGTVYDAGALGFVSCVGGLIRGLDGDLPENRRRVQNVSSGASLIALTEKAHEVVVLIEEVTATHEDIVRTLGTLGDSLDIVKIDDKVKIHLHTDHPDEVMLHMRSFGRIRKASTVDMNEGEKGTVKRHPIGLVTDEGASLSLEFARLHDIAVIPYQMQWGDETLSDARTIYERLRTHRQERRPGPLPTTSRPSPGIFHRAFVRKLQEYDDIICILTSSQVSGTIQSAHLARKMLTSTDQARVHIHDYDQALAGQSLLVRHAVEQMKDQISVSQCLTHLKKYTESIDVFGFGDDPYWLVAGGRIGKFTAFLYRMLLRCGIQPVVGIVRGRIGLKTFVLRRGSLSRMADSYLRSKYGKGPTSSHPQVSLRATIHHSDASEGANEMSSAFVRQGIMIDDVRLLSPIAGIHIGPGAIIIAVAPVQGS